MTFPGGGACRIHHARRQRRAFLFQRDEADFVVLPFEAELEQRIGAVEHGQGRLRNFGTDAVTRQNEDFHGGSVSDNCGGRPQKGRMLARVGCHSAMHTDRWRTR